MTFSGVTTDSNDKTLKSLMANCNYQTDEDLKDLDAEIDEASSCNEDVSNIIEEGIFDGISCTEIPDNELDDVLKQAHGPQFNDIDSAKSIVDNAPAGSKVELPDGKPKPEFLLDQLKEEADYRSYNGCVYVKSSFESCFIAIKNENEMQTYLVNMLSQNNEELAHHLLTKISITKAKKVFGCAKNNPFAIKHGMEFENDGCAILAGGDAYLVQNGKIRHLSAKKCRDKKLLFTYCANASFNIDAHHDAWDQFLNIFIGKNKTDRKRFWQLMGNLIFSNPSAKVFVIMHGDGDDGKSMLCRVIKRIFNATSAVCDSDSHTAFSEFGKSSFKDAKMLFLHELNDELSQKTIDELKRLTGADGFTVNRKNRDMINALLRVKILITCNHLPRFALGSIDKALLNRLQFIKVFAPNKKFEDKDLAEKLYEERDYFITKSIIGFAQLQKNNYQFEDSDKDKQLEEAVLNANPAVAFLNDCCETNPDAYTTAEDFKIAVKNWAEDSLEQVRLKDMREAIKNLGYKFGKKTTMPDRNKHVFYGFKLKKPT